MVFDGGHVSSPIHSLELCGRNEGSPGPRGEHGVYAGYFRDLDGSKLNAYIPAQG